MGPDLPSLVTNLDADRHSPRAFHSVPGPRQRSQPTPGGTRGTQGTAEDAGMMGSTILAPQCLDTPFWALWCCGGSGCAVVAGQGARAVLFPSGRDENTPLCHPKRVMEGCLASLPPHGNGSRQRWLQTHSSHESEAAVLQEPLNLPTVLPLLTPHTGVTV